MTGRAAACTRPMRREYGGGDIMWPDSVPVGA